MRSLPFLRRPPRPGTVAGRLALLLAVALTARVAALGNPVLHPDEQFYLAAARLWAAGATPFVGVWDRKPLGLFLLYRLPAALGDPDAAVFAYQLLALASATATALALASIADRAGWRAGALAGAALYLLWLDLANGQGGQAPVFYDLPMALAAWLAVGAGRGRGRGVTAMALVGVAAQIKYTVVFEGAWFGLWLLWHDRGRGTGRTGYLALLAGAAAAPTLLVALAYLLAGHGGDWWFANVSSILLRGSDPASERFGNLATCAAILAIPVGLAVAGWLAAAREAAAPDASRFVAGWLAAALLGLALFGTWFDHYTLPVLAPASVAAAAVLGDSGRRGRWTAALLVVAALAGQGAILAARRERGTAAEFAALVRAVGRGPGALYVESGPTALFTFTDRPPASRFVYPSHLTRAREAGAIGVDPAAEVARLFARRPAVVVMATTPFRGETPARRTQVAGLLASDGYRLAAALPLGTRRIGVWRLSGGDR